MTKHMNVTSSVVTKFSKRTVFSSDWPRNWQIYWEQLCCASFGWMDANIRNWKNEWMNEKKGYINRKLPLYYTAIDRSIDRPTGRPRIWCATTRTKSKLNQSLLKYFFLLILLHFKFIGNWIFLDKRDSSEFQVRRIPIKRILFIVAKFDFATVICASHKTVIYRSMTIINFLL